MQVKPGEVIAGKYRIERVLGEGGMGVVVEALHVQLDERVAIKFLLPQALGNEEAMARFAREARAAVKIKSEHVARVSDVGVLESGAPYMVMELLQGQDLAALVHGSGPLPIGDAVDFLLQASEAIAEAHALGIVHRDLKPANLFMTCRADGSPCVKVLDFGISKVTTAGGSGSDLGMTRTHAIMGSPLYMSPEQMASTRNVDARADIWALGTILYELLTGRVPFQADTMPQLCGMILQEAVPPPRNLRPDLPPGLELGDLALPREGPRTAFSESGGGGRGAGSVRAAARAAQRRAHRACAERRWVTTQLGKRGAGQRIVVDAGDCGHAERLR
ncbi:MAG: serine/threonine-protein kinase [Polyangiaceae bacterium]